MLLCQNEHLSTPYPFPFSPTSYNFQLSKWRVNKYHFFFIQYRILSFAELEVHCTQQIFNFHYWKRISLIKAWQQTLYIRTLVYILSLLLFLGCQPFYFTENKRLSGGAPSKFQLSSNIFLKTFKLLILFHSAICRWY